VVAGHHARNNFTWSRIGETTSVSLSKASFAQLFEELARKQRLVKQKENILVFAYCANDSATQSTPWFDKKTLLVIGHKYLTTFSAQFEFKLSFAEEMAHRQAGSSTSRQPFNRLLGSRESSADPETVEGDIPRHTDRFSHGNQAE
jgi:hypothetical protein